MNILLIDDKKEIPADSIAKNYNQSIELLKKTKWDILYLDHDLGNEKQPTGYDILCWL